MSFWAAGVLKPVWNSDKCISCLMLAVLSRYGYQVEDGKVAGIDYITVRVVAFALLYAH